MHMHARTHANAGLPGEAQQAWGMGSSSTEGTLSARLPIDCLRRYEVATIHKQVLSKGAIKGPSCDRDDMLSV